MTGRCRTVQPRWLLSMPEAVTKRHGGKDPYPYIKPLVDQRTPSNYLAYHTRTIVVGGGCGNAGISTFNALAGQLDATKSKLILITPRSYFTHLPGTLHMVVTSEGNLEDTVLMPFGDKQNGDKKQVLNAKLTSVIDSDTQAVCSSRQRRQNRLFHIRPYSWKYLARSCRFPRQEGGAFGMDQDMAQEVRKSEQ
jgi:hypothetical protein